MGAGCVGREEAGPEVGVRPLCPLHSGRATGNEIEASGAGTSWRRREEGYDWAGR